MATAIPKAYLASSAIRCRDVETGPNLGVLAVFPSTGATCRCPLPSTGSRGLNAPASAVSGRRRRPSKGSPPSAAQTVRAVFPHTAFTRLPGGREMEGINEWTFCSPVGLSQSASLLGRSLLGLSHKELIRAIGLTHSRPAVSPTTLPTDFPQPTRLPLSRSNGFHRPSGTIRSSDSSHDIAFHFAVRTYRSAYLGASRGPCEASWGHVWFFRTVPSAHTLMRWVDGNAFAPIVRARPCPIFGRPVHHGIAPSITARYCSSYPSDSTSRWTPCPPPRNQHATASEALPPLLDTVLSIRAPEGLEPS